MKTLLSMNDLSIKELGEIVKFTKDIKRNSERYSNELRGKTLVMIFEKPSTRTRISFESAMLQLGGHTIDITRDSTQLERGETIADSAKVLSRYVDAIVARVDRHDTLAELAKNSSVPVINGLSDLEHPCQAISDLFTVYEIKGGLKGINISYIGDGNNVCHSLLLGCAMTGMNLKVASPKGYEPKKKILSSAVKISKKTGGTTKVMNDPNEAARDADFLYTDVWISMGHEKEGEKRIEAFKEYQINQKLLANAKKDCKVMHCLPAHRGMEITDDVLDGPNSIVWDQAENRLHAQKAILLELLK